MKYASLLLAGVSLSAASCVYHGGDTCDDDACVDNGSPVATIRGVRDDGTLRVGANTTVLISGADSTDPDDDVLTYSWRVSSDCEANVTGPTDAVELRLSNLEASADCNVTLAVNDGQHDASAEAKLVVRDTGAFVSAVAPCIATYDSDSSSAQGTPEAPFCLIRDALHAAADYQLAEVTLADDAAHVISDVVRIERSVDIRGGYTREPDWQRTGTRSAIELSGAAPGGTDPTLAIAGVSASDTVRIDSVTIARRAACVAECALVDVATTGLVLSNSSLGTSSKNPGSVVRAASAAGVYYSVRGTGKSENASGGTVVLDNVEIHGASTGFGSVGVAMQDGISAQLTNVTISESARTVIGVRLQRAADIRVERSSITVQSNVASDVDSRADSAVAIGIADGNNGAVVQGACAASTTEVCGGSSTLAIAGSSVTAAKARLAVGVAAFGTGRLTFEPSGIIQSRTAINASGRQAFGLFTLAVGSADRDASFVVDDVEIVSTSSSSPGAPDGVAYGWADGIEGDGVDGIDPTRTAVGLGSSKPTLVGSSVTARVASNAVVDVAAVVLRATTNATLASSALTVGNAGGAVPSEGFIVTRAAALRLVRARTVDVTDATLQVGGVTGTWMIADVIDGQMQLASDDIARDANGEAYGSQLVSIASAKLGGELAVTRLPSSSGINPLRACVAFFGTSGVSVSTTDIACQLGSSSVSETSPTMAGVVTVATRDANVVDSRVALSAAAPTTAVRLVGVQDGSRRGATLGSSSLRIARNIITIDAPSTLAVGVRLSGVYVGTSSAARLTTLVDDNVIRLARSSANIGALVFATDAIIALNSVRVAACTVSNCDQAFGTGFYLMNIARTAPVSVLGNAFDVENASFTHGDAAATPLVVEQDPIGGTLSVTSVIDNVYGTDGGGASALLVQLSSSDFDDVASPASHDTLDEAAINASGGRAEGNVNAVPSYCVDGIHGAMGGPQAGRVTHLTPADLPASVFTDIDGQARRLPGTDAGADVLDSCVM